MLTTYKEVVWGDLSSPESHDPRDFTYLIHGDTGRDKKYGERKFYIDRLSRLATSMAEREFVCASLVSHDRRAVHPRARHGFIISAPPEAIIATSPNDLQSALSNLEEIKMKHPAVLTPEELLSQTSPRDNNEVLLEPETLSVQAIFISRSFDWFPDFYPSLEMVVEAADSAQLPVVDLSA